VTILVTGAGGFVGGTLVRSLREAGLEVRAASRQPTRLAPDNVAAVPLPAHDAPEGAFKALLQGVEHVVHCAGLSGAGNASEIDYRNANAALTGRLAGAAAGALEGRFVYISSIRAVVDADYDGMIEDDTPNRPTSLYGRSKREGEVRALEAYGSAGRTGLAVLRLPPVHGPGMSGNLGALMRLADSPLPLPVGSLWNRRSLISVDSAVRAVRHLIEAPALRRAIYLAADREPVSVAEIISAFRSGRNRPERIFALSPALLAAVAAALGKRGFWNNLTAAQVCHPAALISEGWRPETDTFAALKATAQHSRASAEKGAQQDAEIHAD
jgi:UDP-glucose 4-epimerase